MRKLRRYILASCALVFLAYSTAWAVPKARLVEATEIISTSVQYKSAGRTKSKIVFCLGKISGDSKITSKGILFTPFATTIAKMKARRIGGAKLSAEVALGKAGNSACAHLQRGPTPTPTPIPGSSSNFDGSGNLTAKGKLAFGVPSSVSGNITAGRSLTQSYCTCHEERIGHSFPVLRAAIAQPPMSFDNTQMTDAMLANITAYLNRFNF
jgi:hypothetical protein